MVIVITCDNLDWMTFLGEEGKVLLYACLTFVCIAGILRFCSEIFHAPLQLYRTVFAGLYACVCAFLLGTMTKVSYEFGNWMTVVPGRWEGPVTTGDWIGRDVVIVDAWSLAIAVTTFFSWFYVAFFLVEPLIIPHVDEFPSSILNRKYWKMYTYGMILFWMATECIALTWKGLNITEFTHVWVPGQPNPEVPGEYIRGYHKELNFYSIFIGLNKVFVGLLVTVVLLGTSAWLTKKQELGERNKKCDGMKQV